MPSLATPTPPPPPAVRRWPWPASQWRLVDWALTTDSMASQWRSPVGAIMEAGSAAKHTIWQLKTYLSEHNVRPTYMDDTSLVYVGGSAGVDDDTGAIALDPLADHV